MREIVLNSSKPEVIFSQLQQCLKGEFFENWGETTLRFNNDIGKGVLRTISFDWGVSLIDCDITLSKETKITFDSPEVSPIEFIFISQGNFKYSDDNSGLYTSLEQFQNIIISPKVNAQKTYLLPERVNLKINFIGVNRKEYLKKKNNNVYHLNELLISLFNDETGNLHYRHGGSFSLKIADEVKQLSNVRDSGMLRTLALEGRLYLILALQLLEHQNFQENMNLPESLSKEDILKIHKLTEYILKHISESISIKDLCAESSLSPKKLQLGFRLLYSKTVNEYVRQLKLEISRDYLKNTDLSVSEIVYAVGIKSRSYFSKIFFEAYTILPTDYRKELKKNKKSSSSI
ncbi:helix-turn-helix domain-containing protein [Maribacter sp. X9]|uniref:helix-turn-helix domain-containing protein n=1 Tax=Maribacter sp. X9 TaxID=3402159 RepID=UPI003AF33B61